MAGVMIKKAVLIGDPVAHSRSKSIHEHWLARYDLSGSYDLLRVQREDVPAQLHTLAREGYGGCNVTLPHKEQVCELVDDRDEAARRMGAVNLVVFRRDGKSFGMNTDGYGFIESLRAAGGDVTRLSGGKPMTIIGAGGAARAVFWALLDAIPESQLRIVNRDEDKGRALAAQAKSVRFYGWDALTDAVRGAGFVVNTTSVGMTGSVDWLDVGVDWRALFAELSSASVVCDIVYNPLETSFLRAARLCGLRCVDGLGMLLYQARLSFEAFFGVLPCVDEAVRLVVEAALREKR